MFKKDSWLQGILTGLVLTAITATILYFLLPLISFVSITPKEKLFIAAIIPNMLFIRWFYKTKKLTKTGHGILLFTILITVGFLFWLKYGTSCVTI